MKQEIIEDIEEKVLNLIIFDEDIQKFEKNRLISSIIEDYFLNKDNRLIFKTIKTIIKEKKEVNEWEVLNILKEKEIIQLAIVKNSIPLITQIDYYLRVLYENYVNNLVIQSKSLDDYKKIETLKEKLNPEIDKIKHISYGIETWEENYLKSKQNYFCTLYQDLDEVIGSFQGGDYIALGGATGQGKTLFALNLAWNAIVQDKKVLYCSLEMPLNQLQNRVNCLIQNLNANKVRNHSFNMVEIQNYKKGLEELKQINLDVVTDYKLTIDKLENYISKSKPDFVVIDYLGLMTVQGNNSLYEKVTNLSRQLKVIATEYNIPILVLVQLNRELKNRDDKKPKLSDIRESGAIEQDSDMVLFVHREYTYKPEADKNKIEIIIAKNRHGEAGKVIPLKLDLITQKVTDYGF